ncbi:MAG: membrane dipeptidase, partial [Pyrinomonadaceae bacterium]
MTHRVKTGAAALAGAAALLFVVTTLPLEGCRMPDNTRNETAPVTAAAGQGTDPLSVHRRAVAVDMHADTVQFMLDEGADINRRRADTHLDAVRMKEGGLDAQFFSIWVEPQYFGAGGAAAVRRADEQIAAVRALAERHPETWVLAVSAADVRRAAAEGKL